MRLNFNGNPIAISLIFGIASIPILLIAISFGRNSLNLTRYGARSEGTVIEIQRAEGRRHGTFRPIIRFSTIEGETITTDSFSGSNPPRYDRGDRVTIIYQPNNPTNAKISSFRGLWMAPLIMGAIGILFLGIGLIGTIQTVKETPMSPKK